jgi:hypothetical protein
VGVVAVAIGLAGPLAPAGAATTATLEGEFLISTSGFPGDTLQFQAQCDANGGTFTASASGTAYGPYPGTFQEQMTIVLGAPDTTGNRPVLDAHATFQITSGDTQITGTKQLVQGIPQVGTCPTTSPDPIPGCSQTVFQAFPLVQYDATIQGPSGSTSDSGTAQMTGVANDINGCATIGNTHMGQITDAFILSSGNRGFTGKATGGGQIRDTAGIPPVTFGFTAQTDSSGTKGACSLVDHATGTQIRCLDVTSYAQIGNQAAFSGPALVDGVQTTYRIEVQDNGESGIGADTFTIQTDSGYAASGVLTAGNIDVHS